MCSLILYLLLLDVLLNITLSFAKLCWILLFFLVLMPSSNYSPSLAILQLSVLILNIVWIESTLALIVICANCVVLSIVIEILGGVSQIILGGILINIAISTFLGLL